jgi:hypothetical protein
MGTDDSEADGRRIQFPIRAIGAICGSMVLAADGEVDFSGHNSPILARAPRAWLGKSSFGG